MRDDFPDTDTALLDVIGEHPVGTLLDTITPESVRWLWFGRIPLGKLTVIDGDPGLGKSTLTLDIAARVSRGDRMPDALPNGIANPAGVVLLSAEDDLSDTIRPRLDAAEADCGRIVALRTVPDIDEDRPPVLPDDLNHVRAAIERVGAALVIVDPLMAFLSSDVDGHKDQSVRLALHKLKVLAEETGVAIVVVRHLNKASGGNVLYRGGGSIGIIGAARAGLVVGRDPDNPDGRVLAVTKCNLAAEADPLAFHIEQSGHASRVVWDGVSAHSAASILSEPSSEEDRSASDEACEFLVEVLRDGPIAATDVFRQAREAGISERTLKRAKKKLGVESYREGTRWMQRLKDANPLKAGTLGTVGTLEESEQVIGRFQEGQQEGQHPKEANSATVPSTREAGTLAEPIPFAED